MNSTRVIPCSLVTLSRDCALGIRCYLLALGLGLTVREAGLRVKCSRTFELAEGVLELVQEAREGPFLFLVLDDDGGLDEDEQSLLFLGLDPVGEEAVEDGELGEDRDAGLDLDLGDETLAAEQEGALVGDGGACGDLGDRLEGQLEGALGDG